MLCLSQSMGPLCGCLLAVLVLSSFSFPSSEAGSIGVNYGRVANNLPPPAKVVQLLQQQGINQVKLYDADPTVLRALAGTGIRAVVTVPNELLASAAAHSNVAFSWVQRNVAAYLPATRIQAIAVGNEVFADPHNLTAFLVPAMSNIYAALCLLRIDNVVKVSSPLALTALSNSYPSSAGVFRPELAEPVIRPMLDLLRRSGSYLMVNAYPFFAYEANANVISLDYALFRPNPGVVDAGNGLRYYSLLDAQLDAVFAAMSVLKYDDIKIVVSETGWPSKGDAKETGAGAESAAAYNGNLIRRVLSGNAGTPRRPRADLDVYLFALFNENQKPGPTSERNYGLFYPSEEKVYDVQFTLNGKADGHGGLRWQEERGRRAGNKSIAPPQPPVSSPPQPPVSSPPPPPLPQQPQQPPASGGVRAASVGEKWCVANAAVGKERLQKALDYACGAGAQCEAIQPGAACFEPNTVEAHAAYAFNSYYQRKGRAAGTCDFQGAAYVVSQAPQIGKCVLPSGA